MAKPKEIELSEAPHFSGIRITYVKRTRTLYIGGWYDSFVGIQGGALGLAEFCEQLGIGWNDVKLAQAAKAYKDSMKPLDEPEPGACKHCGMLESVTYQHHPNIAGSHKFELPEEDDERKDVDTV